MGKSHEDIETTKLLRVLQLDSWVREIINPVTTIF